MEGLLNFATGFLGRLWRVVLWQVGVNVSSVRRGMVRLDLICRLCCVRLWDVSCACFGVKKDNPYAGRGMVEAALQPCSRSSTQTDIASLITVQRVRRKRELSATLLLPNLQFHGHIIEWNPSIYIGAAWRPAPHPPHEVYESSQPREQ